MYRLVTGPLSTLPNLTVYDGPHRVGQRLESGGRGGWWSTTRRVWEMFMGPVCREQRTRNQSFGAMDSSEFSLQWRKLYPRDYSSFVRKRRFNSVISKGTKHVMTECSYRDREFILEKLTSWQRVYRKIWLRFIYTLHWSDISYEQNDVLDCLSK